MSDWPILPFHANPRGVGESWKVTKGIGSSCGPKYLSGGYTATHFKQ